MEVSLMEMLDARERRAQRQMQLLQQYGRPLICFTMNIAGPIKNSPLIHRGFLMGKRLLEQQLMAAKAKILHFEEICEKTGNEAIYVLDCDPMTAKQAAVIIEDHTEAGRLFDMDVLRPDGSKVDRQEQNLGARTCLICGGIAQNCARSRTHTVALLQERTQELLETALSRYESRETARLACQALLYEVAATPKPGLVDRANSGSHRDMDFFTFQASAAALWPYFETCANIGMETRNLSPEETFSRLRAPGMVAEGEMLRATGGVNTHKGAIFTMGIAAAAAARCFPDTRPETVLNYCAQMTEGLVKQDFGGITEPKTVGERLYVEHGITGIRGQAEQGFPAVLQVGFPVLQEGLKRGLSLNDAGCATLLHLLAVTDDTNMISRSDLATLREIQSRLQALLTDDPYPNLSIIEQLDREFIERNLSPGGSADLLALTYFLHFLNN